MEITILTTFAIILSFAFLNLILSASIYYSSKKDVYSKLALFWLALIANFFIQSQAQVNQSAVVMAYGFTLIPTNLLAYASIHFIRKKYPITIMSIISLLSFSISALLCLNQDLPFLVKALPLSIGCAAPLFYISWLFLYTHRNSATLVMKIEAAVFLLMAIHSFNFAIFRMDIDAQLWGWLVSYACYQSLAGILPALSLEFYHREARALLTNQIEEKTKHLEIANKELNTTLTEKTFLIRALVHDVSNPLTVILVKSQFFKKTPESSEFIGSVQKMAKRIQNIIKQFRDFEKFNNESLNFKGKSCDFKDALNETLDMFFERIRDKSLSVEINKNSIENCKLKIRIEIDNVVFINSVLANFISNAIKFSKESSVIRVNYYCEGGRLKLSVINYGVGMSKSKVESLYKFDTNETEPGTEGEQGTGFGIPIANRIIESVGGELVISSNNEKRIGPIYTEMKIELPIVDSSENSDLKNIAA